MKSVLIKLNLENKEVIAKLNYNEGRISEAIKYDWNSIYYSAPLNTMASIEIEERTVFLTTTGGVLLKDAKGATLTNENYKRIKIIISSGKLDKWTVEHSNHFILTENVIQNNDIVRNEIKVVINNVNTFTEFENFIKSAVEAYLLSE